MCLCVPVCTRDKHKIGFRIQKCGRDLTGLGYYPVDSPVSTEDDHWTHI